MITLVGVLATPPMLQALALTGREVPLTGRLTGGARAGIEPDAWPGLAASDQSLEAVEVAPNAGLDRYARIMGLQAVAWQGRQVLGVAGSPDGRAEPAPDPHLAAEIARLILASPSDLEDSLLSWRVPMIGIWAASRLRAAASPRSGGDIVADRGVQGLRLIQRTQPFAGYFAVERWRLTHALHQGGQGAEVVREGFVMGDAAVMLPWDPVRDRVLVIEQFRMAPAMRGDPQPWLLEPIAGRVDAGESPDQAILREAREEAGLTIGRLVHAFDAYPSPGAVGEFLYHYVGIADLPDGSAGIHGLAGEAEDIRGHLLDRAALGHMVDQGQITNGPLVALSLWLDARADRLAADGPAGEPARC